MHSLENVAHLSAACSFRGKHVKEKFKCSPARQVFGVGQPAFNVTGIVKYAKKGCKALPPSTAGMVLVSEAGTCAYSKIAKNAAKAGYSGVVVIENKRFKPKYDATAVFSLPVVVVSNIKKDQAKKLRKDDTIVSSITVFTCL